MIDATETHEEGEGKEEMFEFWLQNFVLPDAKEGKAVSVRRAQGASATKRKAQPRHDQIISEARKQDPRKARSANSLTEQIMNAFALRQTIRIPGGASYEKITPREGFATSTIYRVLKENGWK